MTLNVIRLKIVDHKVILMSDVEQFLSLTFFSLNRLAQIGTSDLGMRDTKRTDQRMNSQMTHTHTRTRTHSPTREGGGTGVSGFTFM
jgi:hypothetical protein